MKISVFLIEMGYEDEDPEMVKELEEEIHTFEEVFEKLKIQHCCQAKYDPAMRS